MQKANLMRQSDRHAEQMRMGCKFGGKALKSDSPDPSEWISQKRVGKHGQCPQLGLEPHARDIDHDTLAQ
jgi:hypothetical protein